MKYFVSIVVMAVLVSIATGFFFIGSPDKERMRRFDQQRVSDLQMIQGQILWYWQNKGDVPNELVQLKDDIRDFSVPSDPKTGETYEYQKKGVNSFSLCANFDLAEDDGYSKGRIMPMMREVPYTPKGFVGAESFSHGQGRACFERSIDPELYAPKEYRK